MTPQFLWRLFRALQRISYVKINIHRRTGKNKICGCA
jgi:hypothetical protein